jgi:glucose-6-phosphate 1-dehydrogenase
LNAKNPYSNKLDLVRFEFCEECAFGPNTPDAYSLLFKEIINGNKSLFATDKEVKESWKIIEKLNKIKDKIKFIKYSDESDPESR